MVSGLGRVGAHRFGIGGCKKADIIRPSRPPGFSLFFFRCMFREGQARRSGAGFILLWRKCGLANQPIDTLAH